LGKILFNLSVHAVIYSSTRKNVNQNRLWLQSVAIPNLIT
jgi:hypothetical protein